MRLSHRIALLPAWLALSVLQAHGQTAPSPSPAPTAGRPTEQPLNPEQSARLKAILSAYQPAALTVDDAKAIKRALRDARIRPSRSLAEAMQALGFSVERLEQLDPRPPGPPPGEGREGRDGGERPDGPPPARK